MTTNAHLDERTSLKAHISIEDYGDSVEVPSSSEEDEVRGSEVEEEEASSLQFHAASGGAATVVETMTNLAKTCMGTGCLTLPFAAKQGGILLHVFGMFFVALWNVFASQRLATCWDMLTQDSIELVHGKQYQRPPLIALSTLPPPPRGTATLGKVAWYALGPGGLIILDTLTVILLMGIVIAYNDAVRSFLRDTPFTTNSDAMDAFFIAILITPLSIVPDMGYLTKTSAAGLSVLCVAMLVVAGYGIFGHDDALDHQASPTPSTSAIPLEEMSIQWLPVNGLSGVSQWFGCVVFGFGIVPLTFNFRESMAEPQKLRQATFTALLLVAAIYIAIGLGLLALYPDIKGDVLSELPSNGVLPVITRLAMIVVVMATAPLLIVPCGEIIEGKLLSILLHPHPQHDHHGGSNYLHDHHNNYNNNNNNTSSTISHRQLQTYVRFGICLTTVSISVIIPGFVGVLTFVGSFCVAFVSFCVPPCLHLVLEFRQQKTQLESRLTGGPSSHQSGIGGSRGRTTTTTWAMVISASWLSLWLDVIMLLWGLMATCICSAYVFHELLIPTKA